jgi:hypothetical protein
MAKTITILAEPQTITPAREDIENNINDYINNFNKNNK